MARDTARGRGQAEEDKRGERAGAHERAQVVCTIGIRRGAAAHAKGCQAGWVPKAFGLVLLTHPVSTW
jgi:hypothetical protein